MHIVSSGIGQTLLKELANAIDARLAVAFFSPSPDVQSALTKLPNLSLVISEEFTINDPRKLETLPAHFTVRSLPTQSDRGKLHAKVLIVVRSDKSVWALVGSANMTYQGLFANQEVCVAFDSHVEEDKSAIENLEQWFRALLKSAHLPDLELAKEIFDARSEYRLEHRPKAATASGYWILKTTSGSDGMEHWPEFESGNCIAIGWEGLKVDPSQASDDELLQALKESHPDGSQKIALKTIRKFISMKDGDIVLICHGYASNQQKPVHVYGLARVTGPFRVEPYNGRLWRFKHDAAIQVIRADFPMTELADALESGSLMRALLEIEPAAFHRVADVLKQSGSQIDV